MIGPRISINHTALTLLLLSFASTSFAFDSREVACCISCNGMEVCGCAVVTSCGMCEGCGYGGGTYVGPSTSPQERAVSRDETEEVKPSHYRAVVSRETPFILSFWRTERWKGQLTARLFDDATDKELTGVPVELLKLKDDFASVLDPSSTVIGRSRRQVEPFPGLFAGRFAEKWSILVPTNPHKHVAWGTKWA